MDPIVGAKENEVTIHGNTTINIHSMIATFYKPDETKNKILVEDLNFPTGRYAIESQIKLKGLKVEDVLKEVKSDDGIMIDEDAIINSMTEDVAIAFLPSILYRSGQLLDIEKITQAAHEKGIIIGWDCCHSVGAVQHEFSKWDVDFAVWCIYKYLNGGPGSSAALYINKKHHNLDPGLAGWHGYVKDKQFELDNKFKSANNAGGWQTGTQNILSMAPLEGSLEIFNRLGMDKIRRKSLGLTKYLMYLIDEELSCYGFSVGNPREDEKRGGHVALVHDDARRINEALKDSGVIPDYRYPNVIRLAPIALYTRYLEVYEVVQIIKNIMDEKLYDNYENKSGLVW
jgi:kynureninase